MAPTLPTFTPLENSLWLTLCCRALDNRRPHPILGDATAEQIVRALDYDYRQHKVTNNFINNVALRAKKLDEVTAGFLARHPDAVSLDLGCGLDTRFERLAPPATVDWYDVDFPAVATTREGVVPEHPNAHVIGADVRDSDWLDAVPNDRPALIVADGLMAFLTQDELVSLLDRLIDHLPSGEIVFNNYTKFAVWATQHSPGTKDVAQLVKFPGADDPHDFERWNPRLTLVKEILLSREPEIAQFPPLQRLYYRLQARSTGWSRAGTVILRYRF
jgi:O-methyltransferase involved in polyketide biosynthesis